MHTKIVIAATVAALSLATTAFAAEGAGDPFPFSAATAPAQVTAARDTGSAQYPAYNPALSWSESAQMTLAPNGSEGAVQTANSLPTGAMEGTVTYMQAQSVNTWVAQQAERRFALNRRLHPNG